MLQLNLSSFRWLLQSDIDVDRHWMDFYFVKNVMNSSSEIFLSPLVSTSLMKSWNARNEDENTECRIFTSIAVWWTKCCTCLYCVLHIDAPTLHNCCENYVECRVRKTVCRIKSSLIMSAWILSYTGAWCSDWTTAQASQRRSSVDSLDHAELSANSRQCNSKLPKWLNDNNLNHKTVSSHAA